ILLFRCSRGRAALLFCRRRLNNWPQLSRLLLPSPARGRAEEAAEDGTPLLQLLLRRNAGRIVRRRVVEEVEVLNLRVGDSPPACPSLSSRESVGRRVRCRASVEQKRRGGGT